MLSRHMTPFHPTAHRQHSLPSPGLQYGPAGAPPFPRAHHDPPVQTAASCGSCRLSSSACESSSCRRVAVHTFLPLTQMECARFGAEPWTKCAAATHPSVRRPLSCCGQWCRCYRCKIQGRLTDADTTRPPKFPSSGLRSGHVRLRAEHAGLLQFFRHSAGLTLSADPGERVRVVVNDMRVPRVPRVPPPPTCP